MRETRRRLLRGCEENGDKKEDYLARFINIKIPNVWRVIVGNRSLMIKDEKK